MTGSRVANGPECLVLSCRLSTRQDICPIASKPSVGFSSGLGLVSAILFVAMPAVSDKVFRMVPISILQYNMGWRDLPALRCTARGERVQGCTRQYRTCWKHVTHHFLHCHFRRISGAPLASEITRRRPTRLHASSTSQYCASGQACQSAKA